MLPEVSKTLPVKLEKYKNIVSDELFEEVIDLAKNLKGLRVFHVNSTPRGGGVAEILKSLVPLMNGTGLKAEWHNIPPRQKFFDLTKNIHNALQGKEFTFSFEARKLYIRHMEETARLMLDMKPDIWVIHDPQPAGVISFLPNFHPSIWRLHIDTSHPNRDAWEFFNPYKLMYDKLIFTCSSFIGPTISKKKANLFAPAIDPLMPKNNPLDLKSTRIIVKSFGIKVDKPLAVQVSRFDPWKDPLGVIQAYRLAKKKIPDLQLALLGLFMANDDPEAIKIFREVKRAANHDPDIFLFSNLDQIGSLKVDAFVNAFQTAATVVLQKSIREGFGLTVAEAMWKGQPVIGGNVGGIKLQIEDGKNGFLVSSPEEAAERMIQLIEDPEKRKSMGREAKESIKERFLLPRLLRDYLKLFKELV